MQLMPMDAAKELEGVSREVGTGRWPRTRDPVFRGAYQFW